MRHGVSAEVCVLGKGGECAAVEFELRAAPELRGLTAQIRTQPQDNTAQSSAPGLITQRTAEKASVW